MRRDRIYPYRCFYTWDIHYGCNFRCPYCYLHDGWDEYQKKNRYPGLAFWQKRWGELYERYGEGHIHISGGEPFTYPDIIPLVASLSDRFTFEFDTNMSLDVELFARSVPPGRARFCASWHPRAISFKDFLKRVLVLKNAGFHVGVNFVAYPPHLELMKDARAELLKHDISMNIMPFKGAYNGKTYPLQYSEKEKELVYSSAAVNKVTEKIMAFSETTQVPQVNGDTPGNNPKPPVSWEPSGSEMHGNDAVYERFSPEPGPIVPGKEAELMGGAPPGSRNPHFGKKCLMGFLYTKIHPNGDAYRCCMNAPRGRLGNIIDGDFAFYDLPRSCDHYECPCWKAMIGSETSSWESFWTIGHQQRPAEIVPQEYDASYAAEVYATGNVEAAKMMCAALIAKDPHDIIALILDAEIAIAERRFDAALCNLKAALDLHPENLWALRLIAKHLHAQGKYDEARAYYEKAITFATGVPEGRDDLAMAYVGLAECHYALGREQAVGIMRQAAACRPHDQIIRERLRTLESFS